VFILPIPDVAGTTALDLADTPLQKLILRVDYQPGENSGETVVLAGLQIEVVAAPEQRAAQLMTNDR
jgi:hypothetical protein